MNDQIVNTLAIANLPVETQAATLQSVALGVEARLHEKLSETLDDKQLETLKSKSVESPEVTHAWLAKQDTKLAKLYEQELEAYLIEKTNQSE